MDREGFRSRLKQYKKAREENPGLKYWEWKDIPKYDEGTDGIRDNTYVAPIEKEQVFIPATGSTKLKQDIQNKLTRNGQIKSGAINITSPEFDLLTLGRSIGNAIYKNLPTDMVYRRTTQSEIDDIIESGVFRKLPEGKVAGKGKTFTINGKTVTLHKKGGNAHGGKAFSKGEPWKGTTVTGTADETIVGIPGKGTQWKVGHHGDYSDYTPFENIEKGKGLWEPFNENGIIENISPKGMRVFRPFTYGYKEDGLLPITGLNLIGENVDRYADGGEVTGPITYGQWLSKSNRKKLSDYADEELDTVDRIFGMKDIINSEIRKKVNDNSANTTDRLLKLQTLFSIPFVQDKKIKLTNSEHLNGSVLSENLLDSLYKYSTLTGVPLQDALGLPAQETTFGKYEGFMGPGASDAIVYDIEKDGNYGSPDQLLNDHAYMSDSYYDPKAEAYRWFHRKYPKESPEQLRLRVAKELETNSNYYINEGIKRYNKTLNPWLHAFEIYKSGNYNTGDKNHTKDVRNAGKLVMQDPAIQKWAKEKGIDTLLGYADGGEVGDNDFMEQFGKQVSYKPEETSWWSNVKNWWNDLTGMKNYAYGNCATTPNGKHTKECAHYSNSVLRNRGYKNIVGDAWTRAANSGMKKITSGYDGLTKPAEWDESDAHDYLQSAANNFINNVDTTALNPYDVIGLYYPDSPNTKKAFEQGRWGETQTHTGHIAIGNDGTHYVVHNVGGHLKMNKLADMLTGDYDYLPVSAYRPKK